MKEVHDTLGRSDNLKYEKLYREDPQACGEPFQEFVQFFREYETPQARVLDLGCGQGRDVLFIARLGHSVVGVDISPTGIDQMLEVASKERLNVRGEVCDLTLYEPEDEYDVVILDRVLHMLAVLDERIDLLARAGSAVASEGHLLIADEPSNIKEFENFLIENGFWQVIFQQRGFIFAKSQKEKSPTSVEDQIH